MNSNATISSSGLLNMGKCNYCFSELDMHKNVLSCFHKVVNACVCMPVSDQCMLSAYETRGA